jgi:hypothetical protein
VGYPWRLQWIQKSTQILTGYQSASRQKIRKRGPACLSSRSPMPAVSRCRLTATMSAIEGEKRDIAPLLYSDCRVSRGGQIPRATWPETGALDQLWKVQTSDSLDKPKAISEILMGNGFLEANRDDGYFQLLCHTLCKSDLGLSLLPRDPRTSAGSWLYSCTCSGPECDLSKLSKEPSIRHSGSGQREPLHLG